jgi:hypothetical protein
MNGGLGYMVLRQRSDVLGVYRVRSDNLVLRRMKRPPKACIQVAGEAHALQAQDRHQGAFES